MLPAWGKTDLHDGARHHLAHHCADVAAVFDTLVRRPQYQRAITSALGRPLTSSEQGALTVMAFLHDIGKIAPAFQIKGWPEISEPTPLGHLECGQLWAGQLDEASLGGQATALVEMCGDVGYEWLDVVFAHHGRPLKPVDEAKAKRCFQDFPGYSWISEEAILGRALISWFPNFATFQLPPAKPELTHFISGMLALADWIGSDRNSFGYVRNYSDNYWEKSLIIARKHVEDIGLGIGASVLAGPPDWSLISDYSLPRPAQLIVSKVDLSEPLVILEAETGAGKTEAALWHFVRLIAAGKVEALYFAVPTRAAARQLHGRITQALRRMFQSDEEPVLAIPGQISAGEATGRPLADFSVLWDDGGSPASRWSNARKLVMP